MKKSRGSLSNNISHIIPNLLGSLKKEMASGCRNQTQCLELEEEIVLLVPQEVSAPLFSSVSLPTSFLHPWTAPPPVNCLEWSLGKQSDLSILYENDKEANFQHFP